MSNWKVSKEKIELFGHQNAETLELGKVGTYQVVVQKGLYKTGDKVIFALRSQFLVVISNLNLRNTSLVKKKTELSQFVLEMKYHVV